MIGGGNMGRAIAGGLIAKGLDAQQLDIVEPNADQRERLTMDLGVNCVSSYTELSRDPDILMLAVKPQIMRGVVADLIPLLNGRANSPLIISIAAGITTEQLCQWFEQDCKIVRVMPNTPALVGQGASALFANPWVQEADKTAAGDIMDAVGLTVWVETESQLDAVTALSGSGPAYFFLILEALEAEAVKLGLAADVAHALAVQTAVGSALLAKQSSESPQTLRHQVTSPGGTTERAINTLLDKQVIEAFGAALQAATLRAKELSKESEL